MMVLPANIEIISDGSRTKIDVDDDVLTFGKHPNCSVRLINKSDISNEHAQIVRDSGGYFLTNMDGRNLVTLNKVPLRNRIRQKLGQDDVITLGRDVRVIFRFGRLSNSKAGNAKSVNYQQILIILLTIVAGILVLAILVASPGRSSNAANNVNASNSSANQTGNSNTAYTEQKSNAPTNKDLSDANKGDGTAANSSPSGIRPATGNFKYESKMIGIISSISGKDNYTFDRAFLQKVKDRVENFKKEYPSFYRKIETSAEGIKREFGNNGLNPKLAYILAFSRADLESAKNLFNIPESTLKDGYQDNGIKTAALYTKDLLGAFEQDYLKMIGNYGMGISEAGKANAELNTSATVPGNDRYIGSKRFSEDELDALADFFAAGIVSNSPRDFELDSPGIAFLE